MSITPFIFDTTEIRVIVRDGAPWFFLVDVCRVLEIVNASHAASRLDDDEKHTLANDEGRFSAGLAAPTVINESGLYSLILTSRKPAAKRFKKWVTAEVLPAIRQTGGYMVAAPEETPEQLALRAMAVLQATVERQKQQLAVAAPKAQALDRIAISDGALTITASAKVLQIRPKDLFAYLSQNRWVYKRPGSASYLGYQERTNAGDLEHKVTTVSRSDGSEKTVEQVLITPKGLTKLSASLNQLNLN